MNVPVALLRCRKSNAAASVAMGPALRKHGIVMTEVRVNDAPIPRRHRLVVGLSVRQMVVADSTAPAITPKWEPLRHCASGAIATHSIAATPPPSAAAAILFRSVQTSAIQTMQTFRESAG